MEGAAIATIAGTGISILGQRQQAKAQQLAALQQADAKRLQAQELLKRSEINVGFLKDEVAQFQAQQITAAAASGVDVGSGLTLVQLEKSNRMLAEQINIQRSEAEFKAEALLRGADIDTQLSGDIRKAGMFGMLGTGLSGAGQAAGQLSRRT